MSTFILGDKFMVLRFKLYFAKIYFQKSKYAKKIGNYKKSIKYLMKSKKIYKNIPNQILIKSVINNNIGDSYFKLYYFKEAIEYFKEAIETLNIYKKENNDLYIKIYRNMAICYKELGEYNKCIKTSLNIISLSKDEFVIAEIYIEISHAYRFLQSYNEALHYCNLALDIFEKQNLLESFQSGRCYLSIGAIYLEQEKFDESIKYLEKTESIYENTNELHKTQLINLYQMLEYVYYNKGYKDTAVYYTSKYHKLSTN